MSIEQISCVGEIFVMAGKLRFTIILRREEALENIKEAIRGYLEAFPEEAEKIKEEKELVEIVV